MNYVSANKTKITGALLVAFGVLQTQSETIRGLLDERTFAWFTIAIGVIVAVLGFLNSGGSVTPPGESHGGSSPPPALFIAVLMVPLLMAVSACTGARTAYKEAANLEEYAYVLTEHYAAVVHQAANLREDPTVPRDAIAAIQRADNRVAPLVLGLQPLVDAWRYTRTAQSELELQQAVDRVIIALADLVREVKGALARPPAASAHPEGWAPARQAVLA